MEHVLWDAILRGARVDVAVTAEQLVGFLWQALQPPRQHALALARFRGEVRDALHRLQAAEESDGSANKDGGTY
ncbi:hypothetical protein D3C72_2396970 [compost metagenome]